MVYMEQPSSAGSTYYCNKNVLKTWADLDFYVIYTEVVDQEINTLSSGLRRNILI
jgi:hypothetical protein